jgi:hypothetical protein
LPFFCRICCDSLLPVGDALRKTPQDRVLPGFDDEVEKRNGEDATTNTLLISWRFDWINFGMHSAHATMNASDSSASVHSPMNSPFIDTSVSEISELIFKVYLIRMPDAMHAL